MQLRLNVIVDKTRPRTVELTLGDNSATIADVKQAYLSQEAGEVASLYLSQDDVPLKDEQTLEELNIADQSELALRVASLRQDSPTVFVACPTKGRRFASFAAFELALDYAPATTVAEIKEQIFDRTGSAVELVLLSYAGVVLEDDAASLESCGIEASAVLRYSVPIEPESYWLTVVNLSGFDPLTMAFSRDNTVADLKKRLFTEMGCEPAHTRMSFGRLGDDNRSLGSYGLDCGSVVTFEVVEKAKESSEFICQDVFVKCLYGSTVTAYGMSHNDDVSRVKGRVEEVLGISRDWQRLVFNNRVLLDHRLLSDYGIDAGDTLTLVPRVESSSFTVRCGGRNLECTAEDFPPETTVAELAARIPSLLSGSDGNGGGDDGGGDGGGDGESGGAPYGAFLVCNGVACNDNDTLSSAGIKAGCVAYRVVRPAPTCPRVCVNLVFRDDRRASVELDEGGATVSALKAKIALEEHIDEDRQYLSCEGSELEGDAPLSSYGFSSGAEVHVAEVKPGPPYLVVRTVSKRTCSIPYDPQMAVADLSSAIEAETAIGGDLQRLVFAGRDISGADGTLADNNIEVYSIVGLLVRVPEDAFYVYLWSYGSTSHRLVVLEPTTTTIAQLKRRAAFELEVKLDEVALTVGADGLVNDTATVAEAGIECEAVVVVEKLPVLEQEREPWTGHVFCRLDSVVTVEAASTDTVAEFLAKVGEAAEEPVSRVMLVWSGRLLAEHRTLAEYGVCREATVHAVRRMRGALRLTDGTNTVEVPDVNAATSVDELLATAKGTLPGFASGCSCTLVYNQHRLESSLSLGDYGIAVGDTVSAMPRLIGGVDEAAAAADAGPPFVTVKTKIGRMANIPYDPQTSVAEFKAAVEEATGIAAALQKLERFGTDISAADVPLVDYNVQPYAIVNLSEVVPEEPVYLYLWRMGGPSYRLVVVQATDTVGKLKQRAAFELDLDRESLLLSVRGSQLDGGESQTIAEAGLESENVVSVEVLPVLATKPEPWAGALSCRLLTQEVTVESASTDTVAELKDKINAELNGGLGKARVICRGKVLIDHRSLADYGITADSTIHVLKNRSGAVTITDGTLTIEVPGVDGTSSVDELAAIALVALPGYASCASCVLLYKEARLESGRTLGDYDIDTTDTVFVLPPLTGLQPRAPNPLFPTEFFVTVKTLRGRLFHAPYSESTTVAQLKEAVEGETGIAAAAQILERFGTVLSNDDVRLIDYNIREYAIVTLDDRDGGGPVDPDTIYVAAPFRRVVRLRCDVATMTVDELQNWYFKINSITFRAKDYTFHAETRLDEPAATLAECGVKDGDVIRVERALDDCTDNQLIFQTQTGTSITLDVSVNDYVEEIKMRLEQKSGFPAKSQRLVFCGRELIDGTPLDRNVIRLEATISLQSRWGSPYKLAVGGTEIKIPDATPETPVEAVRELALSALPGGSADNSDGRAREVVLVGNCHKLEDGHVLSDYGVTTGDLIEAFVRVRDT